MVAVFDAKDRIIERANAEALRVRDQAEMAVSAKMEEAERLMTRARNEVAALQQALAAGDDDGTTAARLAAAEAEAARIINAAKLEAATIEAPSPDEVNALEEKIALLESDLEAARFETAKTGSERDHIATELASAREASLGAVSAEQAEELVGWLRKPLPSRDATPKTLPRRSSPRQRRRPMLRKTQLPRDQPRPNQRALPRRMGWWVRLKLGPRPWSREPRKGLTR
jgi:hypothetical protein